MGKNDDRKDYWSDRVVPKLELVEGWARNGASDAQIALNLGIGESTFARYKAEKEELQEVLRTGREDAEILVENAMFKRACGYTYTETTKERKLIVVEDEYGDKEERYALVVTKKVTKHVQPDVNAQMYWLEHRAPKRWEKNPTPGLDASIINTAVLSLADLIKNPVKERQIGSEENYDTV